jgi:50S ribosomal protein L16 3-hydroxylase
MYSLKNIDIKHFLAQYWQKKPLVIKQGFSQFVDPVDENDVAGLSQELDIDSRIVSHTNNGWAVSHGPFEDINTHCLGAWSLLVQSVDCYIPEADALMRAFDFIPHWRMDDLMVSFSNHDAGVGPHLDQYDVFIVQGKGSRRWQVGLPGQFETIRPHQDLSQIKGFEPIIDEVLMPGDIIYIPANHPHNGVALEYCLNYSVGFRAPSQQEMLSSLADYAIDNNLFNQRYTDSNLCERSFSGEIKQQEIQRMQQMLKQLLDSDQFPNWAAEFLSQSGEKPQVEEGQFPQFSQHDIAEKLNEGITFFRSPGVKPVFNEQQPDDIQDFSFYIQGEAFSVPVADKDFVIEFLKTPTFSINFVKSAKSSMFFTQLLSTLVNSGFWYLAD